MGFYFGKPDENAQIYDSNTYVRNYVFLGYVHEMRENEALIEQKNKFKVGDSIEILKPGIRDERAEVISIRDAETGEMMDSCPHPKEMLLIGLDKKPEVYDILAVKA